MNLAIKTKDLCKNFPSGDEYIKVLDKINVEIYKKQLTMLVGPSGCGKTTLLSVITGILTATSGEILLGNAILRNLNTMTDLEKVLFRRQHIGFIFQSYNLLPALTASENAAMALFAAGVSYEDAVKRAEIVLQSIGMSKHTDKKPNQLSGGQQQRVAIARALVHNPDMIVCDEPTAALDSETGKAVMDILLQISQDESRAVLVVTHDPRIYHVADRVLEMRDGKILAEYKGSEYHEQEN